MFKIVTNSGVTVYAGDSGKGIESEQAAKASADDRNSRANDLGISTRYKVAPLGD